MVIITGPCSASNNFAAKEFSAPSSSQIPAGHFNVGEKLVFDVSWFGIPVGTGTLEVREKVRRGAHQAYHIVAVAATNDFLSKLYPVRDTAESYVETGSGHSLEFSKTLSEGRYRADERIVYDWDARRAHFSSRRDASRKSYDIPGPVHDFLSAFFWFREQPVEVGRTLKTVVNDQDRNWDLEIAVLKRQITELKGGVAIDTICVEPKTRYRGMLYDRGRCWVYFTTDARRVPVKIVIQTPFGPVNGVLREPQNALTPPNGR